MAWFLNKWLLVYPLYLLDRISGQSEVLPLGYVAVGGKPSDNERGPTDV